MTAFHLVPESVEAIGSRETMIYFFIGVVLFGVLEGVIIPHDHDDHAPKSTISIEVTKKVLSPATPKKVGKPTTPKKNAKETTANEDIVNEAPVEVKEVEQAITDESDVVESPRFKRNAARSKTSPVKAASEPDTPRLTRLKSRLALEKVRLLPETSPSTAGPTLSKRDLRDLTRTALITFIAMALHNIPEGISVYLAALSNPQMVFILLIAGHEACSCHPIT